MGKDALNLRRSDDENSIIEKFELLSAPQKIVMDEEKGFSYLSPGGLHYEDIVLFKNFAQRQIDKAFASGDIQSAKANYELFLSVHNVWEGIRSAWIENIGEKNRKAHSDPLVTRAVQSGVNHVLKSLELVDKMGRLNR